MALLLADTNILRRLLEPVRSAVDALLARGDRLCFAPQNLIEFWNVCTRPVARNGFGLTAAETDERARLIEGRFSLVTDNERVHTEWRRLVDSSAPAGHLPDAVGRLLGQAAFPQAEQTSFLASDIKSQ